MQITKKNELTIIMGDFSAKISKGRVENIVGHYVLGSRTNTATNFQSFVKSRNQHIF